MENSNNGNESKIMTLIKDVKLHWNEPAEGRYMPFKEILAYAGGGIGVKFLSVMALNMILSSTNVLIGNTLGVDPIDMYILYVLSVLSNIPLSGVRANIIDNTRSKEGKYRPYIVKMGIPSALITILFVWFPYGQFGALFGEGTVFGEDKSYVVKCAVILILNFAQQFFYYFYYEAYDNLLHVLSPNTQERADVATIKGVIYSLAPSIINLAMPIFAQFFTNNNMYDIRLYRYIYPPLSILSIVLCIVVYANTREKIVQAKTHIIQIKFIDSLREVVRNKYFWIIAMGTWLSFLETSINVVLQWLYNYGGICNGSQFSLITLICQNAGLVGMLLAPFCIKKWGKRGVLITTNVFNIIFIALMLPAISIIDMTGKSTSALNTVLPLAFLVLCFWMNNLMNAFAQILTPTINADIRDYQQYISGERIDGMFSTITALGGIITLATSGIVNVLYNKFGINEPMATQVMNDPEVMNRVMRNGSVVKDVISDAMASGSVNVSYFSLYDGSILATMLRVLIIVSIVGAVINVTPYFFYDLTELKQQGIVRVLKIRAFFEDFGNNTLSDRDLVEVVEMVDSAHELIDAKPEDVSNAEIKAARKAKDKQAIQAAKQKRKEIEQHNLEIKLAPFVVKEMSRFDSELGKIQIANAQRIFDEGLDGLETHSISELKANLKAAKALPKSTEDEKEIRKYQVDFCHTLLTARKYQKKYYDGKEKITKPDDTHLNELYQTEENFDEKEDKLYKDLYNAKESKDKTAVADINKQIKELHLQIKNLNKEIRDEQNKRTSYNRSAKPLLDAVRILRQAENYTHFDEIKKRYQEIKEAEAVAVAE